jgi:Rrf2 family protein
MFRVSRRLDYGLQLMTSLASDPDNHSQPTAALASKLDMPLPFLHQIAHVLMQAGLIKATPGQKGGLRLSQQPQDISVLQIITALEGPITLSPCQECDENCPRHQDCATLVIWNDLQDSISAHMQNIRLDMLVDRTQAMPAFPLASEYPVKLSAK